MSGFDDDESMRALRVERLLAGQPGWPELEPELAAFVAALRATAEEPAPPLSPALRALLREGIAPMPVPRQEHADAAQRRGPRLRHPLRYVAGLGLAAKIVLGAGAAAAAVAGAAAIDAVPDAVQRPASVMVSGVVDLFVPGAVERTEPAPRPAPALPAPQLAPRPGGSDARGSGPGPAGTMTGGDTPVTAPPARPATQLPADRSPSAGKPSDPGVRVFVDPGAGPVIVPEVHVPPASPGRSDEAPDDAVTPAPRVVPPVAKQPSAEQVP